MLQEDPSIETYVINERPTKEFNLRKHFTNVFMYIFERDGPSLSKNQIPELDPRAGTLSIMHHSFDMDDLVESLISTKLEAAPCVEEDLAIFEEDENMNHMIYFHDKPYCIVDPNNAPI